MSLFLPTLVYVEFHDTGSAQTQLVLYAIGRYANWKTGDCFPSIETLAKMAKCSERTVRRHAAYLAEQGIIEIIPRRDENGHKIPTLFRLVGYADWYAEQERLGKKLPPIQEHEKPNGQIGNWENPNGQNSKPNGQLLATHKNYNSNYNTSENNIYTNTPSLTLPQDTADGTAWEAPPPSHQRSGSGVSNVVEMARPEPVKRTAGDAAKQVAASAESTASWVKVWRVNDEENFNAWCQWMEANGYLQVRNAYTRGHVFVPTPKVEDGAEKFIRRFPLANPSQMSNTSLSAE